MKEPRARSEERTDRETWGLSGKTEACVTLLNCCCIDISRMNKARNLGQQTPGEGALQEETPKCLTQVMVVWATFPELIKICVCPTPGLYTRTQVPYGVVV